MRCVRCGNENSDENRFCGMCGATLLAAPAPVVSAPAPVAAPRSPAAPTTVPAAPIRPQASPAPRTSAPVSEDGPFISGPSFLGLNDPGPGKRASLSSDPHASSSLDYLLEDEEEHKRGGAGKFILILLALLLAVGLGYLRWKNHGFEWLGSAANKPAAAAQNSDASDTPPASSPAASDTSASTPAVAAQPAPDPISSATNPAGNGPATTPATGSAPPSAPPSKSDAPATGEADNQAADSAPAPAATKEPPPDDPNVQPTANPKPKKSADAPLAKPPAALKPAKAADPVAEAQKYLYGKGAAQDCDRGLSLLKPAANQANPKAMIEMGALYSAGLCTPHDLPTAYRWFALALRKDPEIQAAQTDLQKLWGEMTQPERQLAIKLTQ